MTEPDLSLQIYSCAISLPKLFTPFELYDAYNKKYHRHIAYNKLGYAAMDDFLETLPFLSRVPDATRSLFSFRNPESDDENSASGLDCDDLPPEDLPTLADIQQILKEQDGKAISAKRLADAYHKRFGFRLTTKEKKRLSGGRKSFIDALASSCRDFKSYRHSTVEFYQVPNATTGEGDTLMDRHELFQLDFLEFCMNGDLNEVKSLLRGGRVEPNFQHRMNGWSALHWAARREHIDLCIELISAGFNIHLTDKEGRTPFDVCPSHNSNLKELLRPEDFPEMPAMPTANQESSEGFTPGYLKNPVFPYVKKQASVDKEPASPTRSGYYSYGRRDSATRTRFVLVLTSSADGKEAYKRITVPGGSTLTQLKKSVEAAMRKGQVSDLLILPDRILLEDDEQIGSLADCQKLAVVFDEAAPGVPPEPLNKSSTDAPSAVAKGGTITNEAEEANGSFVFVNAPHDSGDVAHTICNENKLCSSPQVEAFLKAECNTVKSQDEMAKGDSVDDSSSAIKLDDPIGWVEWITASPIRCAATVSTVAASGGLLYALIKKKTL